MSDPDVAAASTIALGLTSGIRRGREGLVEWIVLVPLFVGLVLGRYFRGRALQRLSPLGRQHRARAWWLRWAAGRNHYTPEGWRDQMRALWVPLAGAAASAALGALLAYWGAGV